MSQFRIPIFILNCGLVRGKGGLGDNALRSGVNVLIVHSRPEFVHVLVHVLVHVVVHVFLHVLVHVFDVFVRLLDRGSGKCGGEEEREGSHQKGAKHVHYVACAAGTTIARAASLFMGCNGKYV